MLSGPVRIGIAGAGLIARRAHLPGFAATSDAKVVGVASGRPSSAKAVAKEFAIPRTYDTWQALVADPEIDAVDICAPNSLHAPIALAAAEAHKHILVEKPMAVSLAEADSMIGAAERAGVVLMVAHNLRFVSVFEQLHQLIRGGSLGAIQSARGVFMHAGPDESWGATSDWFWREETAGGGALLDLGIHMIDLLRWVIDRPAVEVSAMISRLAKPTFAEDNAIVLVRFDGDILASVQTSWTARPFPDNQVTIQCENGRVIVGRSSGEPIAIYRSTANGVEKQAPEVPAASRHGDLFHQFVKAISEGSTPMISGRDGRDTLAVALAAYESARSGHVVKPG
jgi:predicted dehydrogenase